MPPHMSDPAPDTAAASGHNDNVPRPASLSSLPQHQGNDKSTDTSVDVPTTVLPSSLLEIILSDDDSIRHLSLADWCQQIALDKDHRQAILLQQATHLDDFVRQEQQQQTSGNLYQRVRALFFLYALHRFHLTDLPAVGASKIPYQGYQCLLQRNFQGAIDTFLPLHHKSPSRAISSALAKAYYHLGFATLAKQVRTSVQQHPGNAWMFQLPPQSTSHPRRFHPDLLANGNVVLCEQTPVRMDLSHCGWSDIFFLGMDYPEGARVLNISVDLAVRGNPQQNGPCPPIESYVQVLHDEPVLKLTSIDLKCSVTLVYIAQVFDFAKDYLGLLRAGIIASGIVPPGLEHSTGTLAELFETLIGPGKGLHLTTKVNDIPKGSRLAVSTNLLGSIISVCMRATQQTLSLMGGLLEEERRLVAARAILGEWLGGSGGGWQDSGGIWPGIKLIEGVQPQPQDPEHGFSRGRLLPIHRQLSLEEAPPTLIEALQDSLVLVHGGMAQNVGPVLEMVTEKYLLRESKEWKARQDALNILDDILESFKTEDIERLAQLTTHNFFEPLQSIIPWASNMYTETLIERTRDYFGDDFLGFWMLGGCSGGGMGFIFKPQAKPKALVVMQDILLSTKREMEHALPFAMDPVVFDYSINDSGTVAKLCDSPPELTTVTNSLQNDRKGCFPTKTLDSVLEELGFDPQSHELIRMQYRTGKIGLKNNRLPPETGITDVGASDVVIAKKAITADTIARGKEELAKGTVGVVTLAAGVGSRWTQGAGCVKAIHPFCKLDGKHRSFLEVHLAKSRRVSKSAGKNLPHVITTSHMTHEPLKSYLANVDSHGYAGPIYLSHGKTIGLRMIPTVADLRFMFEEKQQQRLDEQAQKVKESAHSALLAWAESTGEACDYRDNLPLQCLHPVGHFYEIPNLITNGTLQKMIEDRPQLKYLMLHNIDTVGADVDAGLLGLFAQSQSTLCFEVIPREIEDIGGGLACVNEKVRLVEGLALPREDDEFKLTYYNSMTTWIDVDKLLAKLGLTRRDLDNAGKVARGIAALAQRLPTYVAVKDVKKRWGDGHEDVMPCAQFEKLWGDLSALRDMECGYVVVPRVRGAQLKEQAQLDAWLRDGSSAHLETICEFNE